MLKELAYKQDQDMINGRGFTHIGMVAIDMIAKWPDEKFDIFFPALSVRMCPEEIERVHDKRRFNKEDGKPFTKQMSFTFIPSPK